VPDSYPSQYREMVFAQVRPGRPVSEVAEGLEVSTATVFRWKKQDKIDRGEIAGLATGEAAERCAARKRIAELETELATVERASELFDKGRVVRPKELCPIVQGLGAEGHGPKTACRLLNIASSGAERT
jgi:putative transposase